MAFRDAGLVIRGLILDDRLYYRLGVFNGVQGVKNTAAVGAPSNGNNPGDAPNFAGMLRFNFAGKEEGYGFCQMCFAASPIISLGVSADVQPNSFRAVAPTGATTAATQLGSQAWANYNVDFFMDVPFGNDMELSLDVVGQLVKAGDGAPQSGKSVNGIVSFRFGPIAPSFQMEWFDSDSNYVGFTTRGHDAPPGTRRANVTTYRGGLTWYLSKHNYKISAEIAFQDKENAGAWPRTLGPPATVTIGTVPTNHWVGTLQFQSYF